MPTERSSRSPRRRRPYRQVHALRRNDPCAEARRAHTCQRGPHTRGMMSSLATFRRDQRDLPPRCRCSTTLGMIALTASRRSACRLGKGRRPTAQRMPSDARTSSGEDVTSATAERWSAPGACRSGGTSAASRSRASRPSLRTGRAPRPCPRAGVSSRAHRGRDPLAGAQNLLVDFRAADIPRVTDVQRRSAYDFECRQSA